LTFAEVNGLSFPILRKATGGKVSLLSLQKRCERPLAKQGRVAWKTSWRTKALRLTKRRLKSPSAERIWSMSQPGSISYPRLTSTTEDQIGTESRSTWTN